jgi:uncharacterized protein (DUF488 family)
MSLPPLTTRPALWTIGHSTRTNEEFLALLTAQGIARVVDVRRFPGSRRYPHFHSVALAESLTEAGLIYRHEPNLGGRRVASPDSLNKGWKNASFRGYADYMQTGEFQEALGTLMAEAARSRTVIMCAEAVPWRCHRSLIADRLLASGWDVWHMLGPSQVQPHRLTAFAVVQGHRLLYPLPPDQEAPPRLF